MPVSLRSLLEGRAEQEAGENYVIVRAMVSPGLIPVRMGYEVIGHREGNVLLVQGTFDLREALCTYYDEDELAEMGTQTD